ncbi:hypothetical protein B0T24DRAFT_337752 [Lasiosphaeria ovina]|uniref:HMA domain-containing protein n=1 Tax=Lasiosphaeria ovina TaxID=92902 RepID=A0AAE0K933_9PEZI|nr:hypothetical protein B0T24DRAFT_337752 [Lasiosphaeria ovina]
MSDLPVSAVPAPVDADTPKGSELAGDASSPTANDPPASEDAEHVYIFNVTMTCGGCSGAVDRVLKKLDGVNKYEVSLADQKATVYAGDSLPYDKVLRTIAKTGKKVTKGEADGVEQSVEITPEA